MDEAYSTSMAEIPGTEGGGALYVGRESCCVYTSLEPGKAGTVSRPEYPACYQVFCCQLNSFTACLTHLERAWKGTSLVVQRLRLHAATAWGWRVQSLVGDLRSHLQCGTAKGLFENKNSKSHETILSMTGTQGLWGQSDHTQPLAPPLPLWVHHCPSGSRAGQPHTSSPPLRKQG